MARNIFFKHVQNRPSNAWIVNHNLGVNPVVNVFVETNNSLIEIEPTSISFTNANSLSIQFDNTVTGQVHCIARSSANVEFLQPETVDNTPISDNLVLNVALYTPQTIKLATTSNISTSGHQIIDGILTTGNETVLVKDQSIQSENGVYIPNSGSWVKLNESLNNIYILISDGTENSNSIWFVKNNIDIVKANLTLSFRTETSQGLGQYIDIDYDYINDISSLLGWATVDFVHFNNKRYIVKSLNLANNNFIKQKFSDLTTFYVKYTNNSTPEEKSSIILLLNEPYAEVDRNLQQIIDMKDVNVADLNTSLFFSDENIIVPKTVITNSFPEINIL